MHMNTCDLHVCGFCLFTLVVFDCVCVCVCMCVRVFVCVCMYVCMCRYVCMCMFICMCLYVCVCVYVCVYVCVCVCMCVWTANILSERHSLELLNALLMPRKYVSESINVVLRMSVSFLNTKGLCGEEEGVSKSY